MISSSFIKNLKKTYNRCILSSCLSGHTKITKVVVINGKLIEGKKEDLEKVMKASEKIDKTFDKMEETFESMNEIFEEL